MTIRRRIRIALFLMVIMPAVLMMLIFGMAMHMDYGMNSGHWTRNYSGPVLPALFIAVLVLCNGFLSWWVASGVITPLARLKDAALRIGDGELGFTLERAKDDELGEVTAAFETMRAKLRSALERQLAEETTRKELVAHVSHDLRTPVAVIRGHAEGLRDGIASTDAMRERYLGAILDRALELEGLIDTLFSYTSLDLEGCGSKTAPLVIGPFLRELRDSLSVSFPGASIKFEMETSQGAEGAAPLADPELARRAITNLVENAVKHGGRPSVAITLRIRSTESDVQILVSDDGDGVPDEDIPRLFDPFFRCDRARGRGGSGLGLAIVRRIMKAQGGSAHASRATEGGLGICLSFRKAPCLNGY